MYSLLTPFINKLIQIPVLNLINKYKNCNKGELINIIPNFRNFPEESGFSSAMINSFLFCYS